MASNNTDDGCLLVEALPNLKQRTNLDTLYTDGGHGGPGSDAVLDEQHVTHIKTAIRGSSPNHKKFSLSDFAIQLDEDGKPVQVTCPQKQQVPLYPGRLNKGLVAYFDPTICQACPFWQAKKCPSLPGKRDGRHQLYFSWVRAHSSQRRRQSLAQNKEAHNLRAAIEATVRCVKHPFPASKLPVRGSFRMACLLIGSAGMTNVRRIQHYLEAESQSDQLGDSFLAIGKAFWMSWISLFHPSELYLGY